MGEVSVTRVVIAKGEEWSSRTNDDDDEEGEEERKKGGKCQNCHKRGI